MTIETRGTINLSDITALEYECPKCHAKTVRPLNAQHTIPSGCGNCDHSWLWEGSPEHDNMKVFVNVLRNFPKSSINAHVIIRLEVLGLADHEAKTTSGRGVSRDSGGGT